MNVPENLRYTKDHEWARLEDGIVTVGITDFAQSELGDIVYFEQPEVGKTVSAGDTLAVVESVKSASDVYSPVSGEVVETNQGLLESPESANRDPYGAGWIAKIRVEGEEPLAGLLSAEEYSSLIG